MDVDNIVLPAPAGSGPAANARADYENVDTVVAADVPGDPVDDIGPPTHGSDPTTQRFGARQIPANDPDDPHTQRLSGFDGHYHALDSN